MTAQPIPNLTFPDVAFGEKETPWDLGPLIYKNGASTHVAKVMNAISVGDLGEPLQHRIPVVCKIHEHIEACLTGGGSRNSADTTIRRIREVFCWADSNGRDLSLKTLQEDFIAWTDFLVHKSRRLQVISSIHAYQCAVAVAKIFDNVLEMPKGALIRRSRIRRERGSKLSLGGNTEKQNLAETFKFGHALLDLTDSLSTEVIKGPLPVVLQFRCGAKLEEWTKLRPPEAVRTLSDKKPSVRELAQAKRAAWEADTSFRTRHPLVNMRIESEMLLFIAQTGINLEQAHSLKMSKFQFRSHLDGYQVYRVYKARRHGEVAFEIFSEYRETFERYLKWRESHFTTEEDALLFPLIRKGRLADKAPTFTMVKKICTKLGIPFISPRNLRKTRINWMLRRSADPNLTAEMHAHSTQTLLRRYEQPSLQVAMVEISDFHAKHNPFVAPPGPGTCVRSGSEVPVGTYAHSAAPKPDCVAPAGCLFCEHNQDIDSEDHVWSLASFRHLKSLELSRYRPSSKREAAHPALATIHRINTKLQALGESSEARRIWIQEAVQRTAEDYHHPRWDGFIQLMELGA